MGLGEGLWVLDTRAQGSSGPELKAVLRPLGHMGRPSRRSRNRRKDRPLTVPKHDLLASGSTSAAASRRLTAAPSTAPGAPRGLAAAARALVSVTVGPASPVVAQAAAATPRGAAAPTPRAAAAATPRAGAAAAPRADTAAGRDWGALWGTLGGALGGGTLGRGLALLLVLLAGHLGWWGQELRGRVTQSDPGHRASPTPPLPVLSIISSTFI